MGVSLLIHDDEFLPENDSWTGGAGLSRGRGFIERVPHNASWIDTAQRNDACAVMCNFATDVLRHAVDVTH